LDKLKNVSRPPAIAEVKRLAMMGDFSENYAYQIAKGRLRGINNRILAIEAELNRAEIIKPKNTNFVQIGHTVTLETCGKQRIYQILGSAETDPASGKISHNSPLGNALIGHYVGEKVLVHQGDHSKEYTILKID
jgi:transcription elongation factor GreA